MSSDHLRNHFFKGIPEINSKFDTKKLLLQQETDYDLDLWSINKPLTLS